MFFSCQRMEKRPTEYKVRWAFFHPLDNFLDHACEVASSPASSPGAESIQPTNPPKIKFEVAVSIKCIIRTSAGMKGFGNSSCAFITTENKSPTAKAVSHFSPLNIR